MALDKLKYTYQDPARVSELNVDGTLNVNTTNATTVNSKAEIISPDATNVGLTLRSPALPASDLQQFRTSSNTVTSGINAAGQMYIGAPTFALNNYNLFAPSMIATSATSVTIFYNSSIQPVSVGQQIQIISASPSYFIGTWTVTSVTGVGNGWSFTIAGSGFIPGGVNVGTGLFRVSPSLSIRSTNGHTTPLVIQADPSQQHNLVEFLGPTATRVASMNTSGSLTLLALHPARIQDSALTGAQIVPVSNTPNLLNSSGMSIRALGANQQALTVRSSLSAYTITAATANGTTITYTTTGDTQFIYVGMRATITNVVSTGNVSATAGSGFNLINATIASITGQQFTVTNSLVDTYTSGGTATATTTADIQQWQNSAGTVLAYITGTGGAQFGNNINIAGAVLADQLANRDTSGTFLTMNGSAGNTINTGTARIRSRAATGLPLTIQSANTSGLITAATANGTTITYTSNVSTFIVAGQSVTILGVVSTGNPGATAGSGFNLTNATVATASGTQFTVTNALVDTYTSGGSLTVAPTADLTQWQNSSSTVLSAIDKEGNFTKGDGDQLLLAGQIF